MRKPVLFGVIAIIAVLLGTTAVVYTKYTQTHANLLETQSAEETARSRYADAFNAIAEIQDSLSVITERTSSTRLKSEGLRAEQRLTEPDRQQALESIALLNESIQRTKLKIGALENNLRRTGMKVSGLERMIAGLKRAVAEKQEQNDQLTSQVESLQTRVAGLETTVQQDQQTIVARDQTIEDKRRELATIQYVIGSKKELESRGVIVARGGVLGLGKTVQLTGQFDPSLFTALDTDQDTVVRGPATKARVLSPQPTSSYEIKIEGNQVELRILDPIEFRKVKHLVIMTA